MQRPTSSPPEPAAQGYVAPQYVPRRHPTFPLPSRIASPLLHDVEADGWLESPRWPGDTPATIRWRLPARCRSFRQATSSGERIAYRLSVPTTSASASADILP